MKYLRFIFIILSVSSFAQTTEDKYFAIQSTEPSSSLDDIDFLKDYLDNVKLVGMGESTHGTSEFFTMRHKVFKYLVLHHDFNTFFLEADYATCLDVDRYIKSGNGDPKSIISNIGLWPWKTLELLDLVEWMKQYNEQNPDKLLSFIGCDMQKFQSTIQKMDRLLRSYEISVDSKSYDDISDEEFINLDQFKVNALVKEGQLLNSREQFLDYPKITKNDKTIYTNLYRHLFQIIKDKELGFFSYRDTKMAENIYHHLQQDSTTKGFFWAHNLHVFNIFNEHKKKEKEYKRAGGVLKYNLGSSYFIIAQEFDEGSFNAYRMVDYKGDKEDRSNYKLQVNTVEPSTKGSFGEFFRTTKDSIIFLKPELMKEKEIRYLKMHDIGAVYNPSSDTPNQASLFSSCNGCFDALILIKRTSATNLIPTD